MTKTYADVCIERAEKATEGPWKRVIQGKVLHKDSLVCTTNEFGNSTEPRHYGNAIFIAHARTDVPELARRLKHACEIIRSCAGILESMGDDMYVEETYKQADELEAMPWEERNEKT